MDETTEVEGELVGFGPERPGLTGAQLYRLAQPLHHTEVSHRDGLSYLEAWSVRAKLNAIFGIGQWSFDVLETHVLDMRETPQSKNPSKMNWKVSVLSRGRLTIHATGATYTETAVGGSAQPDLTESMDMAAKTSESDALKRCAVNLGIGLSLYQKGNLNNVIGPIWAPEQAGLAEAYAIEFDAPPLPWQTPPPTVASPDAHPPQGATSQTKKLAGFKQAQATVQAGNAAARAAAGFKVDGRPGPEDHPADEYAGPAGY